MAAATSDDLLSVLDQCPLNGRYWAPFDLLSAVGVVDFFDFFSVGFLVCGSRAAMASDLERQQPFCWAAASERSSARWPAGRLVTCGAARRIQMAGSPNMDYYDDSSYPVTGQLWDHAARRLEWIRLLEIRAR